jgi:hypothetical protein
MVYIAHARQHLKRIKECYPRVRARAAAQKRGDPAEDGRTGAITRLMQYDRLIAQYEEELKVWDTVMKNAIPAAELRLPENQPKPSQAPPAPRRLPDLGGG